MNNDKQKKGWLSTNFRKAVLLGVTSLTLMAGVASNAQAQQAPQHPWSNNPDYQMQIQDAEQLSAGRMAKLNGNEQAALARNEAWHQRAIASEVNAGSRILNQRNKPHGLAAFSQWTTVGAKSNSIEADYRAAIIKIHADYDASRIRENESLVRAEDNIDAKFARLYKAEYTQTQRLQTPVTVKPGSGALTPEQQHDRLVRAYQDAQLKAATSGGKIAAPNPAQFGLSPKDPAIQP